MIGLVLGIGDGWNKAALIAAKAMQARTGIECRSVTDWFSKPLVSPTWDRCLLQLRFPGEDLLIFDADLIPLVSWNPLTELNGFEFAACPDEEDHPAVVREMKEFGLSRYLNAGLMLVRAGCRVLLDALKNYPSYGTWGEQTSINKMAQTNLGEHGLGILDSRFNTLQRYGRISQEARDGSFNPHYVGTGKDPGRLLNIQAEFLGG